MLPEGKGSLYQIYNALGPVALDWRAPCALEDATPVKGKGFCRCWGGRMGRDRGAAPCSGAPDVDARGGKTVGYARG